jgi:hypothetical protein
MRSTLLFRLAPVAVLAAISVAPAAASTLSGTEIRQTVTGKRIYLSVPMGGEFPLYYRPDGRIDGSGEAVGLGRFLKPKDSGRWWVAGDRLCQKWQTWYDGKTFCFTLASRGGDKVVWARDDGEKGVARIGD